MKDFKNYALILRMVACFLIETSFLIFKVHHPEEIVICQGIRTVAECNVKTWLVNKMKIPNFKDPLKRLLQIGVVERGLIVLRQGPAAVRDVHGNGIFLMLLAELTRSQS